MDASLYEFVFHHAAEGILVISREGLLMHVNPAAASMLELVPETCLGKSVQEAFKDQKALMQLASPGGSTQRDIRLAHGRLAHGLARDLDEARIVLLNDVTERYELESRRDALISAISHDLRNPLNALGGYAELVAKFGDLNPSQEKFITRIRQTTSKLYELTATLVDLAWIEAGMPLAHVPVELTGLTRTVMKDLSYDAHKAKTSIVNSIPDELPAVMGDPNRLKQVIHNLLDNALRYSPEGTNVVIHAWHQGDQVYYMVADRGIGISEDEQDKVWDRLWRSSDERVRDIAGGGIGLTYARTVIKRHGGEIWLESKLNQGTTFTFYLPLIRGG